MLYMFSQLTKRCLQTSYYKINNFKINVRCLSKVSTEKQENPRHAVDLGNIQIPKERYTGYKTIYKFPTRMYISLFNKLKYRVLISTVILIPTFGVLDALEVITNNTGMILATTALSFTISLYTTGLLCDNVIAFLYYKDEKAIKIAYVDTRGRRVDIDTSIDDITSITYFPSMTRHKLYKNVHLKSLNFPLKLLLNEEAICDKEKFEYVLGVL